MTDSTGRLEDGGKGGVKMTDAQILYDVLDRLVHASITSDKIKPEHRYSPLGAALYTLHRLSLHATTDCVCAKHYGVPPA